MSRFQDFDDFLKGNTTHNTVGDNDAQKRVESRKQHEPMLKFIFAVFGDYLKTIIEPRLSFTTVSKQKENPFDLPNGNSLFHTYYEYTVNVLYKNKFEYPVFMSESEMKNASFLKDGKENFHTTDWHPNIILQFSVGFYAPSGEQNYHSFEELNPKILIRIWDTIEALDLKNVNAGVSYNEILGKLYSNIWVIPEKSNLKFLEKNLITIFKLLTPYILSHRLFWTK